MSNYDHIKGSLIPSIIKDGMIKSTKISYKKREKPAKWLTKSPEWVLENLPQTILADAEGNITISSDSLSDSYWIYLALDTLGFKYNSFTVEYDPDPAKQYFEIQWKFKIEDIKTECPNFYERWKWEIMDNA